jgi:hypothetical protein
MPINDSMLRVYEWWVKYEDEHPPQPEVPTFREAAEALGYGGPGVVKELVDRLAEEGLMVEIAGKKTRKWKTNRDLKIVIGEKGDEEEKPDDEA